MIKRPEPPDRPREQTVGSFNPQTTVCGDDYKQQMNPCFWGRIALTLALGCLLVTESLAQSPQSGPIEPVGRTTMHQAGAETVVLPQSVRDPLEPVNRIVYAFNKGLMTVAVKPTAKAYRVVVVKPVRTGIENFGKNITYPGRLINNLLQGKWAGARDETYRFGCNTTVGVAGFIDVGTKWNIPKSDADFGQTFGQWGWKPVCYIMLPIFGPSNERDTLGLAADTAANPLTYVAPYPFDAANPLTYFSPYTYCSYGILYNNLTDTVDDYVRAAQSEADAYSGLQYAWTFVRKNRVADFQVQGKPDPASLETLESVFFTFKDPEFPGRGKTRSVLIPATGRKLKFTFWLQPGKAPVVFIVPGLGSHRLAASALALAESVYRQGFSAVCVSSTFNFEFMENASTAAVPAYMPVDVHDLHVALTAIAHRLEKLYPARLGPRALMGYSMGGFESMFVAATQSTNQPPLIKFDRYVSINSPVQLLYGISKLDEYFQAPLAWPAAERAGNIENTFLKVAALSKDSLTPQTSLPFSGIESRFLIGITFRFILRDAIYSSQRRHDLGVLEHPTRKLRRDKVYEEILQYSYHEYLEKFLIPYYGKRGVELGAPGSLEKAGSLRTYAAALQANPDIRLIVNRNDFLLPDEDLAWLKTIFPGDQLTVFEQGGHLGNLSHPAVQKAIVDALQGLRNPPKSGPLARTGTSEKP
jgi:ABC-type transporter lipoprotein component MlaA/pimeloyl-ACP methyl ester carboxylesterase